MGLRLGPTFFHPEAKFIVSFIFGIRTLKLSRAYLKKQHANLPISDGT